MQVANVCHCQSQNSHQLTTIGFCLNDMCKWPSFCNGCVDIYHKSHKKDCIPFSLIQLQISSKSQIIANSIKEIIQVKKVIDENFNELLQFFDFEQQQIKDCEHQFQDTNLPSMKKNLNLKHWYCKENQISSDFLITISEILKQYNELALSLQLFLIKQGQTFQIGKFQNFNIFHDDINRGQSYLSEHSFSLYNYIQQEEAQSRRQQDETTHHSNPSTAPIHSMKGKHSTQIDELLSFLIEQQYSVFQTSQSNPSEPSLQEKQQLKYKHQSHDPDQQKDSDLTQKLAIQWKQKNTATISEIDQSQLFIKNKFIKDTEELKKAWKNFNKEIKLDKKNSNLYLNHGKILMSLHENKQALNYFSTASKLDKNDISALECYGKNDIFSSGQALCNLSCFEKAIQYYYKNSSNNACSPEMLIQLGYCLLHLNRIDEAIICYNTIIKLKPNCFAAYYCKGITLKRKCRNQEALEYFDLALQIQPNNPNLFFEMGKCLQSLQRYSEAVTQYESALRLNPDPEYFDLKTQALQQLQEQKEQLGFDKVD